MKRLLKTALILGFAGSAMLLQAKAVKCDRACLDKTVDTYIAAMVAHDPSQVPFATDVKFVENTVQMKPGEGLWKTASESPTTFKIYVPDPVAEQVGFMCVMKEGGEPIQLGLRLKLKDGKITEAEHVIARNLRDTSLKNFANATAWVARDGAAGRAIAARKDAENRGVVLHGDCREQRRRSSLCGRLSAA